MSVPGDVYAQQNYRCRLDWGWRGAREAAERGDIVVIVDVLRFSSAVATAVEHGASVYPCAMDADVASIAAEHGATAGGKSLHDDARFSLSPSTFVDAPSGTRVVLPSLNGAMCSVRASAATHVYAASLLNATAVASEVSRLLDGGTLDVSVIACGERWRDDNEDGDLRFAIEDYLGAGAVLSAIPQERSPEASVCVAAFEGARTQVAALLWDSASGRELRAMGLEREVVDCGRLDVYGAVPVLRDGWYVGL